MNITAQTLNKTLKIINLMLMAAIVLAALLIARSYIRQASKPAPKPGQDAMKQSTDNRASRLEDYSDLMMNNVFGFKDSRLQDISRGEAASAQDAGALGNIRLLGTISWPDGFGYAVVESQGGAQELYKKGDTLPGIGRLVRVKADGITVDSMGTVREINIVEIARITTAQPSGQEGHGMRKVAEGEYVIEKSAMEASLANPRDILTDARLMPRVSGGVQEGFEIKEVRQGGLYQRLGIQNGDVLLSVNGYKLSNPEAALQTFTALRGMDRITLEIIRGGEKKTLSYIIR